MAGIAKQWNRAASLPRENRGTFIALYIAKVRITVQAEGSTIIREGHGSGEGRGTSAGEVHDLALKAAETDATKRAFATFGKPFGLELYRQSRTHQPDLKTPIIPPTRLGFHPDDTTPIPRAIALLRLPRRPKNRNVPTLTGAGRTGRAAACARPSRQDRQKRACPRRAKAPPR